MYAANHALLALSKFVSPEILILVIRPAISVIEVVGSEEEEQTDESQGKAENEGENGDDDQFPFVVFVVAHAVPGITRGRRHRRHGGGLGVGAWGAALLGNELVNGAQSLFSSLWRSMKTRVLESLEVFTFRYE